MSRYVSDKIRKAVIKRAFLSCEYCLAYEPLAYSKFQLEHIISLKHGGSSELDNLALACFYCNSNKGSDLGTYVNDVLTRFYHPRTDKWLDHFEISNALILPKTEIGEATVKILDFNNSERLQERQMLFLTNNFPHQATLNLL